MEIILTHEQADLDAAGSVLAAWLLDPSRIPVLPKRRNRNLASFTEDYKDSLPFLTLKTLPKGKVERIRVVDTQIIAAHKRIEGVNDVIVWDHHPHRHIFPDRDENIYETTGACTTFLVEMLMERGDIHLSRIHATLLMMGIYEDTGFLSYGTTTSRDIRAAAWLLDNGADPDLMRHYVLLPMTEHQQLACDLLMRNARTYDIEGKQIVIAAADVREVSDEFSAVAHHMRDLLLPDGLVILLGTKTGIRLICRATTDEIDFGRMMKHFSGGGHSRAASAVIPLEDPEHDQVEPILAKLSEEILDMIPDYFEPPKTNLGYLMKKSLSYEQNALIQYVSEAAEKLDMPVYIVGGVVRDLLLDRPVKDLDIVAGGDAILLGKQLAAVYKGRLWTYPQFFTATWEPAEGMLPDLTDHGLVTETSIDLISARSETYPAHAALPVVAPGSIEDDLLRRDFTINTLAVRLDGEHRGELIDICGGLRDLNNRVIRTLHDRSFIDDPTRIFRCIRFEQRFGFMIETDTMRQLREQKDGIGNLTGQRIWHELKLFCGEPYPEKILSRIARLGIPERIHPDLVWSEKTEEECVRFRVGIPGREPLFCSGGVDTDIVDEEGPLWVWFSALPRETITELGKRLLLSGNTLKGIEYTKLMRDEFPSFAEGKKSDAVFFLDKIPLTSLYCYSRFTSSVKEFDLMKEFLMKWALFAPVTTGYDLKQMGLKPGPGIGKVLGRLKAAWIDGEIRTEQEEKALLEQLRQDERQKYD